MNLSTLAPELVSASDRAPHGKVGELDALLHHAGVYPLDELGWLRVTGGDRVRWLNGMVSNSIQGLQPGKGCFNFVLNAQGRIQGTATAFAQDDAVLLQTDRSQVAALTALLDRFIIMDDVELAPSEVWSGVGVAGPRSAEMMAQLGLQAGEALSCKEQIWRGGSALVIAAHSPLVPCFEVWAMSEQVSSLRQALIDAGGVGVSAEAVEWLRLLEGTPRFGVDIRDRELPQETNQVRALHFAKGCYLGQEIVERIRSRGAVHRTFAGFRCEGVLPLPGTVLQAGGKAVGEITSSAPVPLLPASLQIALGYIRREALTGEITYEGGQAYPVEIPFRSPIAA